MLSRARTRAASRLAMVLVIAATVASATSDRGQEAGTDTPQDTGLTEKVEVRLAQYDVVVRDKEGRIVPGLGPEDFRVVEGGVDLEVVAVDEWGGATTPAGPTTPETKPSEPAEPPVTGTPPAPAVAPRVERRSIVLLFDNLNADSALRVHQARRAAKRFARDNLNAEDLTAVYQLDLSLRAISGFSSSRQDVEEAIDHVVWMPSSSFAEDMTASVLGYRSRAGVNYMQPRLERAALLDAQAVDWLREHFYRSLQSLAEVFEGVPGKRILVLLSSGFPMTTPGDIARDQGGFTMAFRDLIRTLSRAGVTVYTVDLGNDLAMGDVSKPIDWRVAVGKLGMDESILTDIGLDTALSSGSAGARRQVLGVLAGETGGRMLLQGDLYKAFEVIDEESTHFYRISCRVPVSHDEKARYRKLTIRVDRPGVRVASRTGRFGDVAPTGQSSVQASESRIGLDQYRSVALRGTAHALPAAGGADKRPVLAVVEALGPLEYDVQSDGGAEVEVDFHLVARQDGEIVRRFSRSFAARIKPDGLAALRNAFRVEAALQALEPGMYDLQATLRIPNPPQYGSWYETLVVPPDPSSDSTLHFSDVVLGAAAAGASPLLFQAQPADGEPDPLVLGKGARVSPATDPMYTQQDQLVALFWLRGLEASGDGPPKFDLTVNVLDAEGKQLPVQAGLLSFQPTGDRLFRGVVGVQLADMQPGAHVLELVARDPDHRSATIHAGFQIEGDAPDDGVASDPAEGRDG